LEKPCVPLAGLVYNPRRSWSLPRKKELKKAEASFRLSRCVRWQPLTGGNRKTMAKTVCKLLGIVFVLVGIAGFLAPKLLGANLTTPHNVVHIVSGLIALYFGFAGSLSGAKGFCLVFGIVYLALGVIGLALMGPDQMWKVPALPLMFGKIDDGIHILLGVVFLAGGLFTKSGG
jgi:hypothetical protein